MDDERRDHRDRHRRAPRGAQHAYPERDNDDAGEKKAELVGGEDVKHHPAKDRQDRRTRALPMHPFRELQPWRAPTKSGKNQEQAADAQAGRDQPGNPCRAEPLPRHRREPLDVAENRRGERDQRRAAERIMELYLASPTALSAAPRFSSDCAMNLVVPAGSAQITPKPRLAMKSL